jgi:hypothetical protein
MIEQSERQKILLLVKEKLLKAPGEVKKTLPPILSRSDAVPFFYDGEFYCILAIVTKDELKKLKALVKNGESPFPYLVKPKNVRKPVAIAFTKSRYALVDHVSVKDMFSFSIGEDCTIILNSFTQVVTISKDVDYDYTIDFAYLISFGEEITKNNLSEFVEELIAYSIQRGTVGGTNR